ncbi:hypothetical protein FQZ97_996240 [compost metagenome]
MILWLLAKAKSLMGRLMTHGPIAFRKWRRRRIRSFILCLREYERDPMLLQLEINRSGVYLTLFWVCVLLWLPLSFFLLLYIPAAREWPNLTITSATPPMYIFEVLWIIKSSTLSDVFKRRKVMTSRLLRKAATRATTKPTLHVA